MNLTLQEIARVLGGEVRGNQVLAPGPGHSPQDRSLAVKLSNSPDGLRRFCSCPPKTIRSTARITSARMLGLPARQNGSAGERHGCSQDTTYITRTSKGTLLFQVVRFVPKGFAQRRPNGSGDWTWSLGDCRRVLYRLPALIEAVSAGRIVCIVEGEKAADALAAIGVCATCSPQGAGKWRDEFSKHFAGADTVLLPDNDQPGEKHASDVAKSLAGVAGRVRVLRLAGLPEGGDVYDWIEAGGDAQQLAQAVELADEVNGPDAQPKRRSRSQRQRAGKLTSLPPPRSARCSSPKFPTSFPASFPKA